MNNILIKLFGFHALLVHGSPMFSDRWFWLKNHLETSKNKDKVLDIGCGSGALTIYAAKKGYKATGISYSEANHKTGSLRAELCNVPETEFIVHDLRELQTLTNLQNYFDIIICFETIEHILKDQQFMIDLNKLLKPNGKLLLTTPNYDFIPLNKEDAKPPSIIENGGHVRKGYTEKDFNQLCSNANFTIKEVSYCSGFWSQKVTAMWRFFQFLPQSLLFIVTLWFRILPILFFDNYFTKLIKYPFYSICIIAEKTTKSI